MNSQYLKELPDEMWVSLLREQVFNETYLKQIVPLVKERVQAFEEFIPNTDFFFAGDLKYENTPILPKGLSGKMVATWFSEVLEALEGLDTWTVASIKGLMETFVEQRKNQSQRSLYADASSDFGHFSFPSLNGNNPSLRKGNGPKANEIGHGLFEGSKTT